VYKNVNTITDTVDLVKSKLDKQNSIHHRLADPVLINNFSQTDQIACSCRVLAAELEGVKLELVIMQTNFENKLDSVISRFVDGHTNINQLKHDLSREKEKSNRLQSDLTLLVRERNIEVDELNETIASLQGKISTVEKT
jgi:acetone carboxylase gamma subunit